LTRPRVPVLPAAVDPWVREFYEHTTRFTLDISLRGVHGFARGTSSTEPWSRAPLGQANVPMNQRQALRGVDSRIDTIDVDWDDVVVDVRRWIRSFADTDEPIYVGIYTTYAGTVERTGREHHADHPERSGAPRPLLTYIAPETRELTTLAVRSFSEELAVFVEDGQLRADQSFWLFGLPFLGNAVRHAPSGSAGSNTEADSGELSGICKLLRFRPPYCRRRVGHPGLGCSVAAAEHNGQAGQGAARCGSTGGARRRGGAPPPVLTSSGPPWT
jgi:hypothetical protein